MASTPPETVPVRPAATIVLVRDGADGLELLMVRRNRSAVFLGGAHVFPGGGVDEIDDSDLAHRAVRWSGAAGEFPWRAAALRELFEETGVSLGVDGDLDPSLRGGDVYRALVSMGRAFDADRLEYFANWVTPLGPPRRFDARFYLAVADVEAVTDDEEVFEAEWVSPSAALGRAESGDWYLEFPTRTTVEMVARHRRAADVREAARRAEVERIAPRLTTDPDGSIRVLLPGDAGFEEAPA